jgi:hypothetical protein
VDIQETPLHKREYSQERKTPFHGGKVQAMDEGMSFSLVILFGVVK